MPTQMHSLSEHQAERDNHGNSHFKEIRIGFCQQQNILRNVYLLDQIPVAGNQLYAALHHAVEEIPSSQSDKYEGRKIRRLVMKYISKNKRVNQHEAYRFDNPPQPV